MYLTINTNMLKRNGERHESSCCKLLMFGSSEIRNSNIPDRQTKNIQVSPYNSHPWPTWSTNVGYKGCHGREKNKENGSVILLFFFAIVFFFFRPPVNYRLKKTFVSRAATYVSSISMFAKLEEYIWWSQWSEILFKQHWYLFTRQASVGFDLRVTIRTCFWN